MPADFSLAPDLIEKLDEWTNKPPHLSCRPSKTPSQDGLSFANTSHTPS